MSHALKHHLQNDQNCNGYTACHLKNNQVKVSISVLSLGTLPPVTITGTSNTANSITVNIETIPDGIERVIIGYHRLDIGQPVVGQYVNNYYKRSSPITFSSLVPGAKYRITAWGLGGGSDRRRSRSPALVEFTIKPKSELNNLVVCSV